MDGQLPRLFRTLPRTPYGVAPIPDFIAREDDRRVLHAARGRRHAGRAPTSSTPTTCPAGRCTTLEALTFHEAVPGHHLQLALQQEMTDLPPLRRFVSSNAFVEGWALYAERLGLEAGFYRIRTATSGGSRTRCGAPAGWSWTPACTRMGWSRQQAIDFMAAHTALSLHEVTTEIDRYIAWPGQALGYKMGELKIRELRAAAEAALGARFDLREFHDVVLRNGSVPLDVLEEEVASLPGRSGRVRARVDHLGAVIGHEARDQVAPGALEVGELDAEAARGVEPQHAGMRSGRRQRARAGGSGPRAHRRAGADGPSRSAPRGCSGSGWCPARRAMLARRAHLRLEVDGHARVFARRNRGQAGQRRVPLRPRRRHQHGVGASLHQLDRIHPHALAGDDHDRHLAGITRQADRTTSCGAVEAPSTTAMSGAGVPRDAPDLVRGPREVALHALAAHHRLRQLGAAVPSAHRSAIGIGAEVYTIRTVSVPGRLAGAGSSVQDGPASAQDLGGRNHLPRMALRVFGGMDEQTQHVAGRRRPVPPGARRGGALEGSPGAASARPPRRRPTSASSDAASRSRVSCCSRRAAARWASLSVSPRA